MTHRKALQTLVDTLGQSDLYQLIDDHIGPPATQAEIDDVQTKLGFALDERFLALFRQANGAKIAWQMWEGEATREQLVTEFRSSRQALIGNGALDDYAGCFVLPTLAELVDVQGWHFDDDCVDAGEYSLPILAGFDEHELRRSMRWIDREYLLEDMDQGYYRVGLLLHERFPDPVVIFTSDEAAALADCHPMRARSYFELLTAAAGGIAVRQHIRFCRGFGADHALVEIPDRYFADAAFPGESYRPRLDALLAQLQPVVAK